MYFRMNTKNTQNMLLDYYHSGISLSEKMSVGKIAELVQSSSTDVRLWTAKALAFDVFNETTVDFLTALAKDVCAEVRVEAIDSLSMFPCQKGYDTLCAAINDPDELVRSYAAFGVGIVGREISPDDAYNTLSRMKKHEHNDYTLVGLHQGLYILGDELSLDSLFAQFISDDYHIQCAVLHALEEVVNTKNSKKIFNFIESLDLSAYPNAVRHTARNIMNGIITNTE